MVDKPKSLTEQEYQQALKEIEGLWDEEFLVPDSPDAQRFKELSELVEAYEQEHFPIKPPTATTITFEFSNPEAAHHFLIWMSESGEQEYWNWMQYREENDEPEGDITAVELDYWSLNEGETFGPRVQMVCGRFDDPDLYPDGVGEISE